MRRARITATLLLIFIFAACLFPSLLTGDASDEQFRNEIDLPPSLKFPLGTDDLGRNRLSRLLTGTRTSLLLAPAAALISVSVALIIGVGAAAAGEPANRIFESGADLTGSLPWLFVLIALRASLPLDAPPMFTTATTFAVLAFLGWAGPARVIRNLAASLQEKDFALQAQSSGISLWRFSTVHLMPNIWPVALAQFWVNIPVFILAEANLGLLGMGVSEPYASLGNQLRELESYAAVSEKPWLLAPAVLLTVIVASMWVVSRPGEQN
jgi:ABC-type dipeptide/oligopeptide/nickel transport system permease subunit